MIMPKRKAEWQNNYIARKYDRLNIIVPKGQKEALQTHAESAGQSLNAYVVQAVDERVERDKKATK